MSARQNHDVSLSVFGDQGNNKMSSSKYCSIDI